MKRFALPVIVLACIAGLLWRFPPIRIVRLADAAAAQQSQKFDARAFAEKLWTDRLMPAMSEAADAVEVVAAIEQDARAARERFGRSVGVSRGYFYFLAGEGVIVSAEGNKIGVALKEGREASDIVLAAGPIFGNAVRDAPGLLNASEFSNSQDFNAIAQELNRRVESEVIPRLKSEAQIGRRLHFVVCVEVRNEPADLKPLKAVPVSVKFE